MKIELRSNKVSLDSDKGELVVRGYVNKSGMLSEVLGTTKKFREKISKGAFKQAIANRNKDIDFLAEHNPLKILSSTRNNSLILTEDDEGLYMEARISPTSYGKDYYTLIDSKIYQNMSFGFRAIKDSWKRIGQNLYERTIDELELFEVSVVKDPAYSQSTIAARGIDLVEEVQIPDDLEMSGDKKTNEKRENTNMQKMETRTNEFEGILRGETRALQTTENGASVIPTNVHDEIILKMEESSAVFARVKKLGSVAGTLRVTREDDSVQAGFVGEGSDILESALGFEHVDLKQKRVGAAITLSNQLINDSAMNIAEYTKNLLARRTVKAVEQSILTGSAETEFKGIIHDTDIKNVEAVGAVDMDTLQELYLSVHPEFLNGSSFIMSRDFFNQIAKLKDGNNHYFMQNGMINGKLTYTLFGLEVETTDALPSTTPVIFGNIEEAVSMMIKQQSGIQEIVDSKQALRGSKLFIFDMYCDSAVVNPQAVAKLTVTL